MLGKFVDVPEIEKALPVSALFTSESLTFKVGVDRLSYFHPFVHFKVMLQLDQKLILFFRP